METFQWSATDSRGTTTVMDHLHESTMHHHIHMSCNLEDSLHTWHAHLLCVISSPQRHGDKQHGGVVFTSLPIQYYQTLLNDYGHSCFDIFFCKYFCYV